MYFLESIKPMGALVDYPDKIHTDEDLLAHIRDIKGWTLFNFSPT